MICMIAYATPFPSFFCGNPKNAESWSSWLQRPILPFTKSGDVSQLHSSEGEGSEVGKTTFVPQAALLPVMKSVDL